MSHLPTRPPIADHEDIAGYLDRCAKANHRTVTELTGYTQTSRVWENPSPQMLGQVSDLVGLPQHRLLRATLGGVLPPPAFTRPRPGTRRKLGAVWCPSCGVTTVEARLHLVVLCPRCHTLLVDAHDSTPLPAPDALDHLQDEVLANVRAAASRRARYAGPARERLERLDELMEAQVAALSIHWPPLCPGETAAWRQRVVRLAREAFPRRHSSRSPSVTATLMALCWPHSARRGEATLRVDYLAVKSDPWRPATDVIPSGVDAEAASRHLEGHLAALGLGFEHVPTTFRLVDDPIVLPQHLRTVRTAQAVALAAILRGWPATSREAPDIVSTEQWHSLTIRMARLATWMRTDVHSLGLLAAHASRLAGEGMADLHRLRSELRGVVSLPGRVTRRLPVEARSVNDAEVVAAAWVWLDATQGRLAGGPHPNMSGIRVLAFDQALNPEGRLFLRQWWQDRTQQLTGDVTMPGRENRRDRRTG